MLQSLAKFQSRLLDWYNLHRRDLPWRPVMGSVPGSRPDPYHVLVSELMLQQTQVATVIPYFRKFIARFPTFADLASADEQEVLRHWQGLGYYSRARNLQQAAKRVMSTHAGELPSGLEELLRLPGIGRYTAGAIASIAFGQSAPILDGNVIRVLCRLDKIETDPRLPATRDLLWARAARILPKTHVGDFNSALMELGALVCTPRAPQCLLCPVRSHCQAQAAGVQESIPPAKKRKPNPLCERWTFCIWRSNDGQIEWLLEQRPASGRWAGLWQFITIEAGVRKPTGKALGQLLPVDVKSIRALGEVSHALTHRQYHFVAFKCEAVEAGSELRSDRVMRWVPLDRLGEFPLPKPHLTMAAMLAEKEV